MIGSLIKQDEPFTDRHPNATIEIQLQKLCSSSNWETERPKIGIHEARRQVVSRFRALVYLMGIEMKRHNGWIYVKAYSESHGRVIWKDIRSSLLISYIIQFADQMGFSKQIKKEQAISIAKIFKSKLNKF